MTHSIPCFFSPVNVLGGPRAEPVLTLILLVQSTKNANHRPFLCLNGLLSMWPRGTDSKGVRVNTEIAMTHLLLLNHSIWPEPMKEPLDPFTLVIQRHDLLLNTVHWSNCDLIHYSNLPQITNLWKSCNCHALTMFFFFFLFFIPFLIMWVKWNGYLVLFCLFLSV